MGTTTSRLPSHSRRRASWSEGSKENEPLFSPSRNKVSSGRKQKSSKVNPSVDHTAQSNPPPTRKNMVVPKENVILDADIRSPTDIFGEAFTEVHLGSSSLSSESFDMSSSISIGIETRRRSNSSSSYSSNGDVDLVAFSNKRKTRLLTTSSSSSSSNSLSQSTNPSSSSFSFQSSVGSNNSFTGNNIFFKPNIPLIYVEPPADTCPVPSSNLCQKAKQQRLQSLYNKTTSNITQKKNTITIRKR